MNGYERRAVGSRNVPRYLAGREHRGRLAPNPCGLDQGAIESRAGSQEARQLAGVGLIGHVPMRRPSIYDRIIAAGCIDGQPIGVIMNAGGKNAGGMDDERRKHLHRPQLCNTARRLLAWPRHRFPRRRLGRRLRYLWGVERLSAGRLLRVDPTHLRASPLAEPRRPARDP